MSWSTSELRVRLAPLNRFKPSSKIFYWPFQGGTSFVDLLCFCSVLCLLCFVRVCLYVLCGHLLGKGWPLGSRLWCLLWVCHFPIGILGQVWYLIVSIPDLCNLITLSSKTTLTFNLKLLYAFFKIESFWKILSWLPAECQTVRIQIKPYLCPNYQLSPDDKSCHLWGGLLLVWWNPVFLGWTSTKHQVSVLLKHNQPHCGSAALFPLSVVSQNSNPSTPAKRSNNCATVLRSRKRLNQNGFSWYSYDPYYEHGYFEYMQYQLYTVLWKENQTLLNECWWKEK